MADISDNFIHVPGKKWCLVQTKPRKEKFSAQNLVGQGVFIYLPLRTKVESTTGANANFCCRCFPATFSPAPLMTKIC